MNPQKTAQILAEMSENSDGLLDSSRVEAACKYAEQNIAPEQQLTVLRQYRKIIASKITKNRVLVESSAPLSQSALDKIKGFVEKQTVRKGLNIETSIDESLIGGIRITCGDIVWERSAKSNLESIIK